MDGNDRPVVVFGAGGHALVAAEVLRAAGREVAGWVTDDGHAAAPVEQIGLERLGDGTDVAQLLTDDRHDVFVAIGDNRRRAEAIARVGALGGRLATAISPDAVVSPSARIGPGALVMPGALVNALASIGTGAIVNTGATVDHECVVGDFAHLAPRCALAGNVNVGEGAFVGIGAVVTPGRALGAWCVVGAGAAVVHDVAAEITVVGVPARARPPGSAPAVPEPKDGGEVAPPPPDPTTPEILVVCTGNLCRSPLVAALLTRELARHGIDAVVRSAGTAAPSNAPPDRRMCRAAAEVGIDLTEHRSVPLTADHLARADLVITMSSDHDAELVRLDPGVAGRTVRLRRAAWRAQVVRNGGASFAQWAHRLGDEGPAAERARRDQADDIADPVGGPMRAYRTMAHEVRDLVDVLARHGQGR